MMIVMFIDFGKSQDLNIKNTGRVMFLHSQDYYWHARHFFFFLENYTVYIGKVVRNRVNGNT